MRVNDKVVVVTRADSGSDAAIARRSLSKAPGPPSASARSPQRVGHATAPMKAVDHQLAKALPELVGALV